LHQPFGGGATPRRSDFWLATYSRDSHTQPSSACRKLWAYGHYRTVICTTVDRRRRWVQQTFGTRTPPGRHHRRGAVLAGCWKSPPASFSIVQTLNGDPAASPLDGAHRLGAPYSSHRAPLRVRLSPSLAAVLLNSLFAQSARSDKSTPARPPHSLTLSEGRVETAHRSQRSCHAR